MDDSVSGIYRPNRASRLARPLLMWRIQAGFPSPAEDYVDYVESKINVQLVAGVGSTGNSRRVPSRNSRGVGPAGVGTSKSCA